MSAPLRDVPVDPDYDELWRLLRLTLMALDEATEAGFCTTVGFSPRDVEVMAAVDGCLVPADS